MVNVLLTQITTEDKVDLEGIYVPPLRKSDTAFIYIHGFGSNFYSGQVFMREISSRTKKDGVGYFKFNTRGHDIVAGFEDPYQGRAFEKFEECVFDIRAMCRFAMKLGYKKIILAGHSTGANKIVYYLYKTKDYNVIGSVLLGPINDVSVGGKLFGNKGLKSALDLARKRKLKNPTALMPARFGLITAQRFYSLFTSGEAEDAFPYYNKKAKWKELETIKAHVLIVFGARDGFLRQSANEVISNFKAHSSSAASFKGALIKDAPHGFQEKERELAHIITSWILEHV